MTVPWDGSPFVYPESLRAALREFIWHLRDALEHRDVTSQAMAALVTTPGATWDDVRAAARAWRESRDLVMESSVRLIYVAIDLLRTWEDGDTTKATAQAGDLQDETAGRRRVKNILADTTWVPSMVREVASFLKAHRAGVTEVVKAVVTISQSRVATERRQRATVACTLLGCFGYMCYRVSTFLNMLHQWLLDFEMALKEKELFADVFEDLAVEVKVEWVWEGSTRLAMDHLMGTLGDIHNLLSSPCGGPGGPVSPGGPGGRSVAKRCQETIEDTPGPCKKQRTAPSCAYDLKKVYRTLELMMGFR
ncbi:hypothetical protein HGM15179_021313 [Zosterops borbonicus]|uniref:Uncharacterized protein n=1 Tax=Zosterops borbonicus TaxID=364589 RepID=A0A8K1D7Z8_9PASS|nr:hypothetical protein HGM15179_021313 [Zosterops borbonicus]